MPPALCGVSLTSLTAVNGKDRLVRVGVGGCPEHVAHAIGSCSGGQGVLKWCTLSFERLHELFNVWATRRRTLQPSRNGPNSSVRFQKCCQPRLHQCFPDLLWNFALREQLASCHQQFSSIALIKQQFQMFVRAPARSC